MKVLNVSHSDYANFGYYNAKAMRSVGINAECMVLKRHPFYTEQAKQYSVDQIKAAIKEVDIIQVMHSCGTMWDLVKESGKRIIVWHTGTRYRQDPDKHNARWNYLAEKVVIALGEFQHLGAKNPEYFGITINTNAITPDYTFGDKIRISHYPSNPQVKGSQTVERVIQRLRSAGHDFIWNYSPHIVSFTNQLRRMNQCDIYVEMCAPEQDGKAYGSYGTTALEAAALGKVVVTNNLWHDTYMDTYGECALEIANNEQALFEKLDELLIIHRNDLLIKKVASRRWVEQNHSYQATGERMKKLLGI